MSYTQHHFAIFCCGWLRGVSSGPGKAEGEAAALIKVLRARGLHADSKAEARIRSTRDVALIDRWLERAVTATSADEVLAD